MILLIATKRSKMDNSTINNEVENIYLCSLCFDQHPTIDSIRNHMINIHDYERDNNSDEDRAKDVNADKTGDTNNIEIHSTNKNKIIHHQNGEEIPNLRPMSMKALKAKLKETFLFRCSVNGCMYSFESMESKLVHEKCHVSKQNVREFKCTDCQTIELFNVWRQCSMHLWNVHKIDVDLLKCPYCTSFKAHLTVQIFRHLQEHGHGRACSYCPRVFEQLSQLRLHTALTHSATSSTGKHQKRSNSKKSAQIKQTAKRWYLPKICEICNNIFANSKTRLKHIKEVHNKIKPFICSICGHKTARKAALQLHMRQHSGEKPLCCSYCNFRAADPSVITIHERRHTKNNEYKCMDCEHTTCQSFAYKNHIKRHHPERYTTLLCNQCDFVSINRIKLERHRQAHILELKITKDSNHNNCEFKDPNNQKSNVEKPNAIVEISSDCFLPLESTDSFACHEPPLDTGGVTIPAAAHSEETQFPTSFS